MVFHDDVSNSACHKLRFKIGRQLFDLISAVGHRGDGDDVRKQAASLDVPWIGRCGDCYRQFCLWLGLGNGGCG